MTGALVGVVASLALVVGLFVVVWAAGLLLARSNWPESTVVTYASVTKQFAWVVATGGAFVIVRILDPGVALLGSPATDASAVVDTVWLVAVAGCAVAASGRALEALANRVRERAYTVPSGLRWRNRLAGGGTLLLIAASAELVAVGLVWLSILWVGVWLLVYRPLVVPLLVQLSGFPRDPTDEERERIERAYEQFDREPGRIVVFPDDGHVSVAVAGRGRFRTVGISEQFLADTDDDQLAIALAQVDERARGRWVLHTVVHSGIRLSAMMAGVLGLFQVFLLVDGLTDLPLEPLLGLVAVMALSLGVLVLLARRARQIVYDADEFTAAQFGVDAVAPVYEAFADDISATGMEPPDAPSVLQIHTGPAMARRLARLGVDRVSPSPGQPPQGSRAGSDAVQTDGDVSDDATDAVDTDAAIERAAREDVGPAAGSHDPEQTRPGQASLDQYATDPGQDVRVPDSVWKYGVGLATLAWLGVIVAAGVAPDTEYETLLGGTVLVAWVLLPVTILNDSRVTRSASDWPRYRKTYLALSAVLVLNVAVGLLYLFRRPPSREPSGLAALFAGLRRRYREFPDSAVARVRAVDRRTVAVQVVLVAVAAGLTVAPMVASANADSFGSTTPSVGAAPAQPDCTNGDRLTDTTTPVLGSANDSLSATVEQVSADEVRVTYDLSDSTAGQEYPFALYTTVGALEVTDASGFESYSRGSYAYYNWTGERRPSLTYTVEEGTAYGNSSEPVRFRIGDDWAFVPLPATSDDIDYTLRPDGVVYRSSQSGSMAYLGEYTTREIRVGCQVVHLHVSDRYQPGDGSTLAAALRTASREYTLGQRDEEVTALALPWRMSDISGYATDDFLALGNDTTLRPVVTIHEYIHTRQTTEYDPEMEWLVEAQASYYAYRIAYQEGHIGAAQYNTRLHMGRKNGEWGRSFDSARNHNHYQRGRVTLAALDREIREATGGDRSLQTVFARLETADQPVGTEQFRRTVVNVSNESTGAWVDRHVVEGDPVAVPVQGSEVIPYHGWLAIAAYNSEVPANPLAVVVAFLFWYALTRRVGRGLATLGR